VSEGVLLDNDVILKTCAYRCHEELMALTTIGDVAPSLLNIAPFTLRSRVGSKSGLSNPDAAAAALEELLSRALLVEPTTDEIDFAAELEELATSKALEFDTGESQLVAILLKRGAPLLLTGDKRAIIALAGIGLTEAEGRVACLEQLFALILDHIPYMEIRARICAEASADKALTACFACAADAVTVDDVIAGLDSYTNDLRKRSATMLVGSLRSEVP
jgi:hypothetical protein